MSFEREYFSEFLSPDLSPFPSAVFCIAAGTSLGENLDSTIVVEIKSTVSTVEAPFFVSLEDLNIIWTIVFEDGASQDKPRRGLVLFDLYMGRKLTTH